MPFDPDTAIGGAAARFPATRRSAVLAAQCPDPPARRLGHEAIATAYWKPVYKYVRVKWRKTNEEAKDLTQGFFARAIEKGFFDSYDPARSAFRTFLRVCVDGFVANEEQAGRRLKRGGGAPLVPLDFETAEGELASLDVPANESTEEFFRREWVRSLFGMAVEDLRAACAAAGKDLHFRLFERYDLDDDRASYAQLAAESGIPATSVANYLAWARRTFRARVLERLRELTASEEEFRNEVRLLLGGGAA
jgi:DNA-directed RNA polymerase specialized sigma24 family protein